MEILRAYIYLCTAILQENINLFGYSISLANVIFYTFIGGLLLVIIWRIFSQFHPLSSSFISSSGVFMLPPLFLFMKVYASRIAFFVADFIIRYMNSHLTTKNIIPKNIIIVSVSLDICIKVFIKSTPCVFYNFNTRDRFSQERTKHE